MDAIRELVDVKDRMVTIQSPAHFRATRVEVIVLDAGAAVVPVLALGTRRRQPSPLLADTQIMGDMMLQAVDEGDRDTLK